MAIFLPTIKYYRFRSSNNIGSPHTHREEGGYRSCNIYKPSRWPGNAEYPPSQPELGIVWYVLLNERHKPGCECVWRRNNARLCHASYGNGNGWSCKERDSEIHGCGHAGGRERARKSLDYLLFLWAWPLEDVVWDVEAENLTRVFVLI